MTSFSDLEASSAGFDASFSEFESPLSDYESTFIGNDASFSEFPSPLSD